MTTVYHVTMLDALRRDLRAHIDPEKAAFFPRFFRTGRGEYGEGDVFIGITVPQMRAVAKIYKDMPLTDIAVLLADPVHEFRLTGLLILVSQFTRADAAKRKAIVDFYLANLKGVNNWDLVDSSAPQILGTYLLDQSDTSILDRFAQSKDLWKQRIAIVATQAFIRAGIFEPTICIATILTHHPHDLIHKAVGWMLREVGKRDEKLLRQFLDTHAATMPRTMLRYAIEKFPEADRKKYLQRKTVVR